MDTCHEANPEISSLGVCIILRKKCTVSGCIITDRSIWKSYIIKCFSNSPVVLPTTCLSQVMIYRLLNVSLKQKGSQLCLQSCNFPTWKKKDKVGQHDKWNWITYYCTKVDNNTDKQSNEKLKERQQKTLQSSLSCKTYQQIFHIQIQSGQGWM
jgi:hypothetical protein